MQGKELKAIFQELRSTAGIQFSPQAKAEVWDHTKTILDMVCIGGWGKTEQDALRAIENIPDDKAIPKHVEVFVQEIQYIRLEQSPFASAKTA